MKARYWPWICVKLGLAVAACGSSEGLIFGFICASAGVDASNASEADTLILLPLDPDRSAALLRDTLGERSGRDVGVLITDSFGRPWRQGTTDVAIGAAGVEVLQDLKGQRDPVGHVLRSTVIATGTT